MATPRNGRVSAVTIGGAQERAPGARPLAGYGHRGETDPGMWPGITTGHYGDCKCSWAVRGGQEEVKYRAGNCPVGRHRHGQD